ncbi:hypothetical protein HMPREF9144_1037 [Prevotella pallens ATCC 700821]|uniref:Uncharacterized protein n=2 Tax=Prevotella pallens TaxID=60133 RepID=A0A379F1W7_9BACT|nr:hypothetical protein HMPREF9144_1037 [Prevotella pallens ATCC 700821]RAS44510.1 hypothetical protein BC673_11632 [Prevotella pallens]SUC12638.1 Uncharacterised protein [Prevotella pallens]VTY03339.1 Uncharacterised protein [uncultured Prevotella sp.]
MYIKYVLNRFLFTCKIVPIFMTIQKYKRKLNKKQNKFYFYQQ